MRILRPLAHPSFWSPSLERRDPSLCFWVALSKPISTPMRRGGDNV